MSELTSCNYCTLQDMRRRVRKEGAKIVTRDDDGWIKTYKVDRNKKETDAGHSFMALTSYCVC